MHDLGSSQRAIALTCQGKQLIDALFTNSPLVVSNGDLASFVNVAAWNLIKSRCCRSTRVSVHSSGAGTTSVSLG